MIKFSFVKMVSCFMMGACAVTAQAAPVLLGNYDDMAIGTKVDLWDYWGGLGVRQGEVVADPTNASNHVLHVTINNWGQFAYFPLPEDYAGSNITRKEQVVFRIYRANSDQNDWKKIQIYQDHDLMYEDDGYPHQGDKGVWQWRSYNIPSSFSSNGTFLALGFNSDASDYYIDDVQLRSADDDFEDISQDTSVDISEQNSSSSYKIFSRNLNIAAGVTFSLTSARYTYWTGKVKGEGRIDLHSGGERTYLGGSDKKYPDWSNFHGEMHVYPYKGKSSSNGFYGLCWMHNGKTFNADAAMTDVTEGKANSCLAGAALYLHEGAALASESGTRGMRIGHLETEAGSQVYGYLKNTSGNHAYYIIGGSNKDATLAGRISPFGDNLAMQVGLIKEGRGTYRITGNNNLITGGIRVLQGRVLLNNDATVAQSGKLSGALGTPQSAATTGLYVMTAGIAGGTGHIAATTNLYGILQPGDDGIGHLAIADYAKSQTLTLIVRPTARIDCEIESAASYDEVTVAGPVNYYNIRQDFAESEQMPRIRISLTEGASLQVGDEFTLFTAQSKKSYNDVPWEFDIRYPKSYTWEVSQILDADGFRVVAKVISLAYSGQGDIEDDPDEDNGGVSSDDGAFNLAEEQTDETPLRQFVDDKEMFVGTCVPVWTIPVYNANDNRTKLIAREYNMVVCENEMKFDATEPSQGQFSYGSGDQLVNFAAANGMRIRGHALAWHSQVPTWLTADGNKNTRNLSRTQLLAILKNHIFNVVGHWKGKIAEWDVANEVLDDNQTSIYSNPNAYDLRPSVWRTGIGEDFLDSAFVWAHQADPDAILILNDYGVEGKGWGKSEALYNLAKRLKNSGIPIDGVGLQCHMDVGLDYISSIEDNIKRFGSAGFQCHVTELDLGIHAEATAEVLEQQASNYYSLARIAMRHDNCKSMMIWGLSDDLTWRNGTKPLLFDADLNKKPAYWGVHAALRQAAGRELEGIEEMEAERPAEETGQIHDLMGRMTRVCIPGHLYIYNGKKFIIK